MSSSPHLTGNFKPYPLLAGGHRQTLAACYLAARPALATTVQHHIRLDDGDQLVLHDDCPPAWQPGDQTAMLVHGLCGSHQSRYVVRITNKLYERGVRVFRLDLRGSGAGELLARTFTHCGRSTDLEPPINRIAELAPGSPLSVAGFSLGGALTLSLATHSTKPTNWTRAIAVCPPVDLFAVEQLLNRSLNRQYDQFFARQMWDKVIARSKAVPGAPNVDHLPRPKRLRDFDESYTVPLGGYRNADDYYEQTSVARHLHRIEIPTLIIAAANDPIVPIEPLREAQLGSNTYLLSTGCGGHLGFVGRRGNDPDRYWLDWRVIEWILGDPAATEQADAKPATNWSFTFQRWRSKQQQDERAT
ncbi:YheT family hydrolase [Aeoliella mucimassa]|uniref:Putative hydrolase n=1 Tax=Aeoliella mucimassa TaxID=2527972 RepID=A0A518AMC6_9BACT|nr:alpha/beta fold hydrolase [Aeoliella mucimassa]QDU55868.1 putative hydrolase [Aeoliella mucimassa]